MTQSDAKDGQLAESAYRHLFDNSPNAVVFCNLHGNILFANNAFEHIFGLNGAEIVGRSLEGLLRPPDGEPEEMNERVD